MIYTLVLTLLVVLAVSSLAVAAAGYLAELYAFGAGSR